MTPDCGESAQQMRRHLCLYPDFLLLVPMIASQLPGWRSTGLNSANTLRNELFGRDRMPTAAQLTAARQVSNYTCDSLHSSVR